MLEEEAPWTALKKGSDEEKAAAGVTLVAALEGARVAAVLLAPVVPALSQRLLTQLGLDTPLAVRPRHTPSPPQACVYRRTCTFRPGVGPLPGRACGTTTSSGRGEGSRPCGERECALGHTPCRPLATEYAACTRQLLPVDCAA